MLRGVSRSYRRLTVLIAEDHDLVRLGLRSLLQAYRPLEVVAEASTVASAVIASVEQKPSLVVAARTLRDGTGVDVCREILARLPETRVVIVGDHVDADAVRAASGVGALGYLSRRMGAQSLCRALHDLAAGAVRRVTAPPTRLRERLRAGAEPGLMALTTQEHRVLELVARGKTNKEIGSTLGLSEKTVKNYLSHAFEKLSVSRRAQAAVLFAKEYGVRLDPLSAGNGRTAAGSDAGEPGGAPHRVSRRSGE
jgi:two-component system, NarL family, response regulator DevR